MSKLDRMLEGMKDYEPDKKGVDEEMDESAYTGGVCHPQYPVYCGDDHCPSALQLFTELHRLADVAGEVPRFYRRSKLRGAAAG